MLTVVTGASGHIGGNLVRRLLAEGRKVRVLVREDTRAVDGLDAERVRGDILDKDSLLRAFAGAHTVFNLAALISIAGPMGGRVLKTNIEGPSNVVEACRMQGVKKLVHFSSIHAFRDPEDDTEVDERTPMADDDPSLCYDFSKAGGQKSVLGADVPGLDIVVVNPGAVLGPNDFKPSRMGAVLMDIYHHRLPMLVNGGYNWVDVRDVVEGALAAEHKGRHGECYLLTGHWAPIGAVAQTVKRLYGVRVPEIVLPLGIGLFLSHFSSAFVKLLGRVPKFTPQAMRALKAHRNISCGKACSELGYKSRPLEETVRDTIGWFLDQEAERTRILDP